MPIQRHLLIILLATALLSGCGSSDDADNNTALDANTNTDTTSDADGSSTNTTCEGFQTFVANHEFCRACSDTDPIAPPCQGMAEGSDVCFKAPAFCDTTGNDCVAAPAKAFTNITADTPMTTLNVTGTMLGVTDFDNDGLPDIIARSGTWEGPRDDFGPEGDRRTWLLRNTGDFNFEDVTQSSGLTATTDGGEGRRMHAVVWGDVDNDGDLDAFTGLWVDPASDGFDDGDRSEIMLNNGDGTFTRVDAGDARGEGQRLPLRAPVFTDFDRDGILDLFVGYGHFHGLGANSAPPDKLFKGDGTGRFTDVSESVGIITQTWSDDEVLNNAQAHPNSWGATVCDLNNDGWPDIVTSVYSRGLNMLWQGGPNGFTNRSLESGAAYDESGDWRTNQFAQCYCQSNPDATGCDSAPNPQIGCGQVNWNHTNDRNPFRNGGNTFTTACADLNNDGFLDLYNFEIVHWWAGDTSDESQPLFNTGEDNIRFTRPGVDALGLRRERMGNWDEGDITGAIFDFDNDGRKDVLIASSDYPGTRAFLFQQKPDGTFTSLPINTGIDHTRAAGIALADYDRDGDLDIVLGHSRMRCSPDNTGCMDTRELRVFRNDIGSLNNWLQLKLVGGTGSNTSAIGAQVTVVTGDTTQTFEVGGGYGHFGIQGDLTVQIGLGTACQADEIRIRWPDAAGTTQTFTGVDANRRLRITQGNDTPEEL